MKSTILSCAITGSFTTREHNKTLPVTPDEIAQDCIIAAKAGAAICHIHVRDPETGTVSMELGHYREVVQRIRESDTDLIINLTTGPGGRFLPSDDDPAKAAPGTALTTPEIRSQHVVELRLAMRLLDPSVDILSGLTNLQAACVLRDIRRCPGVDPQPRLRFLGKQFPERLSTHYQAFRRDESNSR